MTIPAPIPRLTVITLGVSDMRASIAFYAALGFARKLRSTGDEVAFFETGATVLGLYPWSKLASDAALPDRPRPAAYRGTTLAWNCRTPEEVDAVLAFVVARGARLCRAAQRTDYGGYCGFFSDPDGHLWEVVAAPGIEVGEDRRVHLAD